MVSCYQERGNMLIQKLLADTPHEVLFLTLNYDDLLENSLALYCEWKADGLDDYIAKER